MKRIVITFGLISGGIAAVMMFVTIPLVGRVSYEYLTVLGYTIFVACFLMVFFGIRSYRDNVGGGTITFGKALTVGILITLLSCAIYTVSWDFIHRQFLPTFMDDYFRYVVENMRAEGAAQEALNRQIQENEQFKQWYRNPFIRYAMTLLEAFPVGLLMTLISSLILKRKTPTGGTDVHPARQPETSAPQ
jgi:ethanolamine transporter EutH